ncbi:organic cation transporter-like protein [Exaiptasia diaphana]|uniref:Major facilitator superfamily (MFS) profile domain-containing protein n=2 Tax=Exaiptasia diaphana TaxID=2652724 RepID=A0A913WY59_EXADI|nr:organic cation transporter-like protein [Exaiptasia diaphana]KXJ05498.1 Organic cation transporter-like protein [Exaiptasia diaphana]
MVLSVDEYLEYVGVMGRFQWLIVVLVGLMMIPVTFQTLIMTFLGLEPEWKCVNSSIICNFTQTFSMSGSDPNRNFRCKIPRSEWEFTKEYNSIVTEWDLVCDKSSLSWATTSIMFTGWLFGNVLFGIMSDKYGRKKILFISSCMVCWLAFISSFIPYFWLYVIFRFFIGFGLGGSIVCLFIMATEFVGPQKRAMAGTFSWYFWTGALMLIALLAYLIRDWRKLSITTSSPGILLFLFWFCIPESVRWMMTHEKEKEAQEILNKIGKFNKRTIPEGEELGLPHGQKLAGQNANFFDLFGTRSMTKKTIISWISWFVNGQVYFGVSLGSVLLGGNMYLNFFLTSLIELPGNAFAIWAMDKFGRKIIVVVGLIVGAIGNMLVTVFPDEPENQGYAIGRIVFALVGKFAIMCSFDAIFVFSAELFPTVIRNIGMGSSSAAGRLGAITAPFVIWLSRFFAPLPYIIMAVDAFIAGFLCLLLPETNKEPTAETLQREDSEEGLVADLRPDGEEPLEELKKEKEEDQLLDKKNTVV